MKYFIEKDNGLLGDFEFRNFEKAIAFINQVANISEISKHHPDIHLHDYKYVKIICTTHDAGRTITDKDYAIAQLIESSYKKK